MHEKMCIIFPYVSPRQDSVILSQEDIETNSHTDKISIKISLNAICVCVSLCAYVDARAYGDTLNKALK